MNFFYQFYTSFTGSPIVNSDLLQLNQIFIFLNGLFFVLSESKYSSKLTDLYPAFYLEKNYGAKKSLSNFLYELMMTAIESIWILYFTIFSYIDMKNSEGIIGNMHMVSISIGLTLQFLTSFKFVIRSNNSTTFMFIITIIQTALMLGLISFLNGFLFLSDAIDIAGYEIFSHFNAIYILVSTTLFTVLFSWVMWETVLRRSRFPILFDVEEKVKSGDLSYLIKGGDGRQGNKNYLDRFNDNEPFSSVVANSFSNSDSKFTIFYV